MKGVYKKCGLLLAFAIMPLLSLVVCSNTNALKHSVTAIPIHSDLNLHDSLSVRWNSEFEPSSVDIKSPKVLPLIYNLSDSHCDYDSSMPYDTVFNGYDISYLSFPFELDSSANDYRRSKCRQNGPVVPTVNTSTLPSYAFGRPDFRSMLPNWVQYSQYKLKNNRVSSSTGVHYNYQLSFKNIYGVTLNKFKSLTIPVGKSRQSVVGDLTSGRHFELRGMFDFSGSNSSFEWNPNLNSSSSFYVKWVGLKTSDYNDALSSSPENYYVSGTFSCVANLVSLEATGFNQLEFSCPFDLPYDFSIIDFTYVIDSGFASYVWDSNIDWKFYASWVITDYDETPAEDWSEDMYGSNPELEPSNQSLDAMEHSDDGDFFSSLSNLFNFSVINPFQPLYDLFTPSDSCVNIPTIASMIHLENSQVCPYFPSTVRSIATPVLGLSSMMLLFGFVVHWLGARSGNLFEDSVETDNFTFANKFRRRK